MTVPPLARVFSNKLPPFLASVRLEVIGVVAILVLFVVPTLLGGSRPGLILADLCCTYVIVALGQNMTLGYLGQLSVAQAALTAVGGYSGALLVMRLNWPWALAFPAAVVVATAAGALLGLVTNRVRIHYLVLITLAFHTLVLSIIINNIDITGGPIGLYPIPPLAIGPYQAAGPEQLFYLAVVFAVLLSYASVRLQRSRVGLAMSAVKENERAAQATGINPAYYRILGMALGGLYAGVGGVLFASLVQFLGPSSFGLSATLFYVVIVVLGGLSKNVEIIVVAVVLTVVNDQLSAIAAYRILIYGLLVIVVMAVAPDGLPATLMQVVRSRLPRPDSRPRRTLGKP
jgi:branched-chain amino acid transport system permease protein